MTALAWTDALLFPGIPLAILALYLGRAVVGRVIRAAADILDGGER